MNKGLSHEMCDSPILCVKEGSNVNYFLPYQPTWIERLVERKLKEIASNPKKKKRARRAAAQLLWLKRFLDLVRCS